MGRPIHKEDAMGNEFTGFEDNAPTLTLEPDLGEPKAEIAAEPEAEAVKKEMEQTVLSPEESADGRQLAKKLTLRILTRSSSTVPEPRRKWLIFPMQLLKMYGHRIWVRLES